MNRAQMPALVRTLIALFIAFDVAFLWQRLGGAYASEFGAHPDEAAHYVTGLFVRDAVTALPGGAASLKPFAPDAPGGFYAHYPKVALGVWPPAFYLVQTAWTLPFGSSRLSLLLLMALLAGAVALLLYRAVREELGEWPAVAAALLWLSAPLVRAQYGMVMAETLSTLAMFGATLCWGRFLDAGRTRDALCFGLLAAVAILTKGTGLALALMAGLSLLLTRRWALLRTRGLCLSAALVAVLAGPWTWYFRNAGTKVGGWADNAGGLSAAFTREALPFYAQKLLLVAGAAVAVFALLGLLTHATRGGRWAAAAGLVLGVFIFQCILPVGTETRHLIPATPALVLLAFAGVRWLARRAADARRAEFLWAAALTLLALAPAALTRVEKAHHGFRPVAEFLVATSPREARILVSSDAVGEGMFISEIAMHDARPNLFIERASKSLVQEKGRTWDGKNLRTRFDDEALLAHLTSGKIRFILLDEALPERHESDYHRQLARVIAGNEGAFYKISETPLTRDGEAVHRPLRLYRVAASL